MKTLSLVLGMSFLSIAAVLAVLLSLSIQQGEVLSAVAVFPGVLVMVVFGILSLRYFSVATTFAAEGLTLRFPVRTQRVDWSEVLSYRNLGYRGKLSGGANIWVMLRYRVAGAANSSIAILLLPGEGPVVSLTSKDYTTALNRYIPDKDWTRRRKHGTATGVEPQS